MNERYIVGKHAVMEALTANAAVEKIFLAYGADDAHIHRIRSWADKARIPCSAMDKRKFSDLERSLGIERNDSQGVIALRALKAPLTLSSLLTGAVEELASERSDRSLRSPLIVVLDGITDPHNLGAIARSAEGAGAYGLVVPENYTAPITPVVVKASAGAIEHLNIARVKRVSEALKEIKEAGWTVLGTGAPGTTSFDAPLEKGPIAVVIGAEGEGLHERVRSMCDRILEIPMQGKISSLNASVAAGIVLFEIVRQQTASEKKDLSLGEGREAV